MKILKILLVCFTSLITIKSQTGTLNQMELSNSRNSLLLQDSLSEKIIFKNSNNKTLFEIIDEFEGGSIRLPPISSIDIGTGKLYNLDNTIYWNDSPLIQSSTSEGWQINNRNLVLSDPSILVGIGSLNPQQKLHVENGRILVKGSVNWFPGLVVNNTIGRSVIKLEGTINDNNYSSGELVFQDLSNGKTWSFLNTNQNNLTLVSHLNGSDYTSPFRLEFGAPTNSLTVNSNGNVGIGTWSNTYKLAVAGTIISEEVIVKLEEDWPDFVFSKEYKLPSLNEQEKFILENHHLLGFPSAEDLKKEGVNVGNIQAKLLQKIEELMLYVIQQEKNINILEKQIDGLKLKLEE